jgi:gluconokinase
MVVVVMGVSGCGKTTVGRLLASRLGWMFTDADDFHSPVNRNKMRSGQALSESDRQSWLAALRAHISERESTQQHLVLACSALTKRSRVSLAERAQDLRFVHLVGSRTLIRQRLANRTQHFMPPLLLDSQFETLETPDTALTIDISATPAQIATQITASLGQGPVSD